MPVAETSGNDAIAALLDRYLRCAGYRLPHGPETREERAQLEPCRHSRIFMVCSELEKTMFRLAERLGSCEGVYCGREGLYVGSAALIERRDGQYRIRQHGEVTELLTAAYGAQAAVDEVLAKLNVIAAFLHRNDFSQAMIAALQLRLGEIAEDASARITKADVLLKYHFDPLQPRDWHGRWSGYSTPGVMPARAAGPASRSRSVGGRAWERFPNAEFRNRLAIAEGSADKPDFGYGEVRRGSDALGRYQMTPSARRAAGMIDANGNWTGRYGVHSRAEFLADHTAQENALTDYLRDLGHQLGPNGSYNFLGQSVDGLRDRFTITQAGLIAAAHREGAPRTRQYLSRIAENGYASHGLALNREELAIETRLRSFSGISYE